MTGQCEHLGRTTTSRRAGVTEKWLVIPGGGQAKHTNESSWQKLELEENQGIFEDMRLVQHG